MSRPSPLDGINLLELRPCRCARWQEVEERVVIERPRPEGGWRAPGQWITFVLSARRIRLDAFGSSAWRQLDGHRTVAEVAVALRREHGETIEPAEERLGEFVRSLRREGLLLYPEYDPPEPRR